MSAASAEVRALRGQMTEWRRGRADTSLMEALSDAYIALFATCMLGAMVVNAVIQTRFAIAAGCGSATCQDARGVTPWLFAGGLVVVTLAAARMVGPLLVSPAVGAWLLAAPVDRAALLRPRLLIGAALAVVTGGVLSAGISELVGFAPGALAAFAVAVAGLCLAAVMFAAIAQPRGGRATRVATWLVGLLVWGGLVMVAAGATPSFAASPTRVSAVAWGAVMVVCVLAVALSLRALAGLPTIHRDRLTPGGSLLSSLSGALASLDLSLMYDILVSRRWLTKSTVRPVRGGPGGAWALVWRDVIRLRRSAESLVLLGAALVVPYVAAALDLGAVVALISALTAFVAGLALCLALRTTSRTPGLIRCFPMSGPVVRSACLAVPSVVLLLWALATAPALHRALAPISWPVAVAVAVAVGVAAIGAITRWLLGRPPDYSKPMVSSPMGAIPTGLIGAVLRGFDVLLLLTAPVLISPTVLGVEISLALAAVVLAVLLGRK